MKAAIVAFARSAARGDLPALKLLALVLLWLGIVATVYVTSTSPRSAARRAAVAYAAAIDAQMQTLFMAPLGAHIAWSQACAVMALLATYAFLPVPALVYVAAAVLVLPKLHLRRLLQKRRAKIDDQVNGFTLALANALKTTASIGDALRIIVDVTAKPLRQELETALKQVRVGSPLDDALLAMSARAAAPSLDIVISTLLIGRQTGGDLPRILEGVAASLRELKRLEEMTEKTSNSAKQSVALAAAIVVALVLVLPRVLPGFFDPLRETLKGQLVAVQCVVVFLLALFLAYRFTRISI
jgi:tight adherence protein B